MRDKSECFISIHHPFLFFKKKLCVPPADAPVCGRSQHYYLLRHLFIVVITAPTHYAMSILCGIDKTSFSGQGGLLIPHRVCYVLEATQNKTKVKVLNFLSR